MTATAVYSVELDEGWHPVMVKEREVHYGSAVACPQDAVEVFQDVFRAGNQAEEHVYLLSLDTRKHILALFDVSHGQVHQCAVNAREIFIRALVSGASSIILVHNHPSGSISASDEDKAFTQRMKDAGDLLGIQLDDSIIISSSGTYFSFMEAGQLP